MPIDMPPPPPAIVITDNGGGVVEDFMERASRYSREGREIRIMGSCRSACVLYLGAKNVCVGPNAVVKAHEAYEPKTGFPRPDVTLAMMNHIPVKVSARLWPYITKDYNQYTTLNANQLVALGVRRCSSDNSVEASDKKPRSKPIKVTPGDPITGFFLKLLGAKL